MRKIFALVAIAALAYGVVAVFEADVTAAPAFVLNSGRDGLTCTLSGAFNGTGDATVVINSGGNVNFSCSGTYVEAPPPSAIVTTATGPLGTNCILVLTPSNNFSASCH